MRCPEINNLQLINFQTIVNVILVFLDVLNKVHSTGNISALNVIPILHTKNHGNLVQLRITWESTLPNNARYDVIISTTSNATLKPFCDFHICSEYDTKLTDIVLPKHPEIRENGECILKMGCDYNILVESANKDFNSSIDYSINECINEICSCHHEFFLPKVDSFFGEFNAQATELHVAFSYDNVPIINYYHDIRKSFTTVLSGIRLRLIKFNGNPKIAWSGRSEVIYDETYLLRPVEYRKIMRERIILSMNNTVDLTRDVNYTLRATLIDDRNCEGRIKDIHIYLPPLFHLKENIPEINSTNYNFIIIIAITSICFLMTLLSIIAIFCANKYRKSRKIVNNWRGVYKNVPSLNSVPRTAMNVQMQENALYIEKEILEAKARGDLDILEIPHGAVKVGKEIGKGAFGRVFCATAMGIPGRKSPSLVAVKQLKRRPTTEELEEFLGEILTMKRVGKHPNIVSLLGFCTVKQPLMMIMEFVGCGDLLGYLRKIREKRVQSSQNLNFDWKPNTRISSRGQSSSSNSRSSYSQSNIIINSNSFSNTINNESTKQRCNYPDMFRHSSISSDASTYTSQPETIVMQHPESIAETMTTLLGSELGASSLLQFSNKQGKMSECLNYILDHNELHNFALQIARGMKHLEDTKITHRDLAARNILIDENKVLKISDFGLSRTGIYINTKNKRVPLRWLSLEAIRDNLYSSKSDVWAYGIVLWEIGTLGGFPYPTVCNTEILNFLSSGNRLERPENCTKQLYNLMLQCWAANPNDRPDFQGILDQLDPQKQPIYIDFNELDPNYAFPPTIDEVGIIHQNNTISSDNGSLKM